jgi:antirestriction protein ArdC
MLRNIDRLLRMVARWFRLYDEVTATIIIQLEAGSAPWARPWSSEGSGDAMPANAMTKRHYSGVNVLILWGAAITKGYQSKLWLTYKQAQMMGANVRKGEKATTVVKAGTFVPDSEKVRAINSGEDERAVSFLKRFAVFNIAQVDGLPAFETAPVMPANALHSASEALLAATGADIRIGGSKAFYSPSEDFVQLVPVQAFAEPLDYYRTAFHEVTHWSGHSSRLNRKFGARFGDSAYAREELVAELGAAFVCASLGIQPTLRHADYLGSWLKVLKEDNRAIFGAASRASKACDYILASQSAEMAEAA